MKMSGTGCCFGDIFESMSVVASPTSQPWPQKEGENGMGTYPLDQERWFEINQGEISDTIGEFLVVPKLITVG